MFIAALFAITKIWKQPKCPRVAKIAVVHLHNGILLGHQKRKSWKDLEIIMLSEISQSEKDKNHKISLICGI